MRQFIFTIAIFTIMALSSGAVLDEDQIELGNLEEIEDKTILETHNLTHGHHSKHPQPTPCSCKCHTTTSTPWTTTLKPVTTSTHRPVTTTTRKPITTTTRRPTTTTTRKPITTTTLKPITTTTRKPVVTTTTPKPGHCHCPKCPATTTPKPTRKPCVCPCPVTTPKPTPKPCHCPCRTPVTCNHHGCTTPVPSQPCVGGNCCPTENGASPVYISHPTNPKNFYVCSWGLAYVFNCPKDTVFDKDLNTCVYPQ